MRQEVWKAVAEFPRYQISSLGRVKGVRGGLLSPYLDKEGYHIISLRHSGSQKSYNRRLSVLVAETFIGPRPVNYHVHHLDNNKNNNKVNNLKYVTPKENNNAKYNHGVAGHKLDIPRVIKIRNLIKSGLTNKELSIQFNVTVEMIGRIRNGKAWINAK